MISLTFLFDPRSPWCYQTSRWIRRLAELGEVSVDWGLFSLELVNLKPDEDPLAYQAEYGPALRTAVTLLDRHSSAVMGDFYRELGRLMWEVNPPEGADLVSAPSMAEISKQAVAAIGLDPSLVDDALADPASWQAVLREHCRWIDTVKAFGVPTLVFDDFSVFGPVIRELPDDETSLELWRHVWGLIKLEHLYEAKKLKPLSLRAGLPAAVWRADLRIRDMRAGRALMAPGGPEEGASLEWAMAAARAAAMADS